MPTGTPSTPTTRDHLLYLTHGPTGAEFNVSFGHAFDPSVAGEASESDDVAAFQSLVDVLSDSADWTVSANKSLQSQATVTPTP